MLRKMYKTKWNASYSNIHSTVSRLMRIIDLLLKQCASQQFMTHTKTG